MFLVVRVGLKFLPIFCILLVYSFTLDTVYQKYTWLLHQNNQLHTAIAAMPTMACNDHNHVFRYPDSYILPCIRCFACRYKHHFEQHILDGTIWHEKVNGGFHSKGKR